MKWIKIVTDIFSNKKIKQIEALPAGDSILVIWFKILCLAGTVNEDGAIFLTRDIPYTEEMLATEFRRPIDTVRLALKVLQQFGMIEIIDNIYRVSNWEKYQNIDGLDKIREQTRIRTAKYREKQKLLSVCDATCDVTVTECDAPRTKNKNKKENKKKETIRDLLVDFSPEFQSAFMDYSEMRTKIKKPLTARAAQMALSKLQELSKSETEQIAIINQSVFHSWQGLFELKDKSQQQNQSAGYGYEGMDKL